MAVQNGMDQALREFQQRVSEEVEDDSSSEAQVSAGPQQGLGGRTFKV